ncbi:zf-HC2 domain-containing protein [Petrachloros mirabilis]
MKDHLTQWIDSGFTCRDIADRASDYHEGRLPLLIEHRVSRHLPYCKRCRTYLHQVALVSSTLRRLPKIYPTPMNRLLLHQYFTAYHLS